MDILIPQFKEVCMADETWFDATVPRVNGADNRPYWFKDNGSRILAVAHTDYVAENKSNHFGVVENVGEDSDTIILHPGLDDRAGVHVILNLLPAMSITTDILLTTDEEVGRSTASLFDAPREYNWIVAFDRKGDDFVLYEYKSNEQWVKALMKHFPNKGFGSASDISKMEDLGCSAVNIGVGYADYHSMWARLHVNQLITQLERFKGFHMEFKDTFFKHKKKVYGGVSTYSPSGKYQNCPTCGKWAWIYNDHKDCHYCKTTPKVTKTPVKTLPAPKDDFPLCPVCDKNAGITYMTAADSAFFLCLECVVGYATCDDCSIEVPLGDMFERSSTMICEDCFFSYENFHCSECGHKWDIKFLSWTAEKPQPKCVYCSGEEGGEDDEDECDYCGSTLEVAVNSYGIMTCDTCSYYDRQHYPM